jgi:DNA-binding transcriptional LysR family regulator
MPVNLPTALLRSFVAIVDTGSMLNASEQVFVTQSALSLQIKRLEELVQQQLFRREGRKLVLTAVGELMLDYARRILELHDQALASVSGGEFSGPVRVGMVQDFADTVLSGLLAQFAELHPEAQIYARVAGTHDLRELLERGQLDLIVGFAAADHPRPLRVVPMDWFGSEALLEQAVLPLAVLEKPCRFRAAAQQALEAAGIPYRIAIETPNLSTLRAAVEAGLGVTVRTSLFLDDLTPLATPRLPTLPPVAFVLDMVAQPSAATRHLATLTVERVAEHDGVMSEAQP